MTIPYNQGIEEHLKVFLTGVQSDNANCSHVRDRFLIVDRYIARESDLSSEKRKGRLAQRNQKTKIAPIEVPVVQTRLEAAHAFFANQYFEGFPIFGAVGRKESADASSMMHALMQRDQRRYKWVKNGLQNFRDGLKYNIMASELTWDRQYFTVAGQGSNKKPNQQISAEGNKWKRLNPYNLLWDHYVEPCEVAERGMYAGYVERHNYVASKQILNSMSDEFKIFKNLSTAFAKDFASGADNSLYYSPKILSAAGTSGETDWGTFWGFTADMGRSNTTGIYEHVTLYIRIIPKDFGIIAPRSGSPTIFKVHFLNSIPVYFAPVPGETFPIKMGQIFDEGLGLETKSFAENLIDLQDEASALKNARMSSLRRAISDRALFDPTRVNSNDLSSSNPEAKIPVKMNQFQKDLSSAYYQIPYRDDQANSYNQEFAALMQFADEVSSINKPAQGSFQKGNKTLYEFQQTMGNSESRMNLISMSIGSDYLHDIKQEIKHNYLANSTTEKLFDRKTNSVVEIDQKQLQEEKDNIIITDGFMNASKVISADILQVALQTIPLLPELNQMYSTADMFVYLLKNQGLEELDDFKREQPLAAPGNAGQPTPTPGGQGQPV